MTVEAPVAGEVTNAVVRSLIDRAGERPERGRIIGIRATPDPAAQRTFEHRGETVQVVPCVSALAVRAALLDRADNEWLIILTDRSEEDLGAGILAHFASYHLKTPDPWDAIKQRFGATSLDRVLAARYRRTGIAAGLLRISPEGGWPAAPAGALSADHAFGSVARERLGLDATTVDALSVLAWAAHGEAAARIADLRVDAGHELTDAVLEWLAGRCGEAEAPVRQLFASGAAAETLPLGLALSVLTGLPAAASPEERGQAQLALARLDHRWTGSALSVSPASLAALGVAAGTVVRLLLSDNRTWRVGRRAADSADQMLRGLQAESLAASSDVLPSGFDRRFRLLADALRSVPDAAAMRKVEDRWAECGRHALFDPPRDDERDPRVVPFRAAVRLARWLAEAETPVPDLAAMARRQAAVDAWVDSAYNDAASGVLDPSLGESLEHVLGLVEARRRSHDREFAAALALSTSREDGVAKGFLSGEGDRVRLLERVLPDVVVPLAHQRQTLLVVLDGMSTGTATELIQDVLDDRAGWHEILPKGQARRGAALAVLPTLTEFSRTSLLCGRLTAGGQAEENTGFPAAASGITTALHHKKPLDTSRLGYSLLDEIYQDITGQAKLSGKAYKQLVGCVLNTIDDALDRTDPGGTTWTQDAVKHLRELLTAAMAAERAVVLTADHGHIVERRRGSMRKYSEISSARSRSAAEPAGEDEVLVEGTRVLAHGGRAVLAVDETLRYGPLKAGYHGGAAPAEAVVPVAVLVPAGVELPKGWELAPVQEPVWWRAAATLPVPSAAPVGRPSAGTAAPSLFDDLEEAEPAESGLGAAVIASSTYKAQAKLAGRVAIPDTAIALLVDALASASGSRLQSATAAVVLQMPASRIRGAVATIQRLLNVEGYAVLRTEGTELLLDVPLLREQFEVRA